MRLLPSLLVFVAVVASEKLATASPAHIAVFPYVQNFDSIPPPALPTGWTSTQNRISGTNDFVTSTTTPRSVPNAAGSTNATISQTLISPLFDFQGLMPDSLVFHIRRSTTHNARMLVEVSLDSGRTYSAQLGDSLRNTLPNSYQQIKYPLPAILATSREVRFRWRIVADTSGTTGTLRIDDITISARRPDDLELADIQFRQPPPIEGDSIIATAKIRNVGQQSAVNFYAELYLDANRDSLPQPTELRASVLSTLALSVGDSVQLQANIGVLAASTHQIIGRVVFVPDQNLANNQRVVSLVVGYPSHSVVVNEMMYAPSGTEPEWVELFNTRTDSIDLQSWLISDNLVTIRRVITAQHILLPPLGFAVLTRDSVALIESHPGIRSRIIGVPNFPSLNNSGDAVVLYDNRSATMDSVAYVPAWGGSNGNSLERIDPWVSSVLQSNWKTSRSVMHSTPGERNSVARRDRDLTADSASVLPMLPVGGDSVQVRVLIKNVGREAVSAFNLLLFCDANTDSLPQAYELVARVSSLTPLLPLDSVVVSITSNVLQAGSYLFMPRVDFAGDEDSTNNMCFARVVVGHAAGTMRVNEVMYAPNAGVPEWVELINTSTDTVDMSKWLLGNRSGSSRYEIAGGRLLVLPDEVAVIAKDTALLHQTYPFLFGRIIQTPALPTFLWSNNGDAVVLVDNRKIVMDSVYYFPTWGGLEGKSLERIDALGSTNDSTNWATSADSLGATPARKNSLMLLENDLRVVRVLSDTVAPGAIAQLRVVVQNAGKLHSSQFALVFFDDANGDSVGSEPEQFYRQTVTQTLALRESTIIIVQWAQPSSGIHRVIVRADYNPDQRPSNNSGFGYVRVGFAERALVINEIMYSPLSGKAEYVELFNASQSDVDLWQWKLHDRIVWGSANEFKLCTSSRVMHPEEYFVLCSDSTFAQMFPSIDDRLYTVANQSSLGLNNEGDDIVLVDPAGTVVDSLSYSPAWHNANITDKSGRALEKINPLLASTNARHWTTCAYAMGGTPGRQNSVFTSTLPLKSRLSISPNPFSPDGDGREDFAIIQYEMPLTVSMIRARVYDAVGRRIRMLVNNEASGARGSIVWDGMDDDKQKARVGIYIVLLDAIDDRGGVVETAKGVVVLAAKL